MNVEHTKGQLTTAESAITANEYTIKADGNWLLKILHNGEQTIQTQRENIRRLAACWNACQGISTESLLESGAAGADDVAPLLAQNEALQAAISKATGSTS